MEEKKYFNIYKIIKDRIVGGEYSPGQKLPSKRVMADHYGCSVITVETAYSMLAEEGYIVAKERSGYFVCHIDTLFASNTAPQNVQFQYLEEPTPTQHPDNFEYSLWFKTIRKVLSEKEDALFVKSPNMGCAILRNALADYLYRYRGMIAEPQRIIIGSGAEQLYETVVKILGRNLIYGIEDPSYHRIEAVYTNAGATIQKLKLKDDGIAKETLQNSPIDVLHVTPFRSYPTNVTVPISKRYEYLRWASNGKYIVEDDYNSEFFIPGQPIETLYALDTNESVIYMNTFSKSLSPSMRIGYMILPKHLLPIYEEKLGEFSCSVPVLDQYVLAEYISSGNFERHLNRIRRKEINS